MSGTRTAKSDKFFEMLLGWLQSLPADIKILIEMISDNKLAMKARCLAAGTVIYFVSPIDLIPDKIPVVGHIDDVIILRLAVVMIVQIDPERGSYYRQKYPQFETLNQQIDLLKEVLGALYGFLQALVASLVERHFRGHTPEDVVDSEQLQEDMFDAAMEHAAGVNVDPETIQRALLTTPPERIVKLLSDGLEQDADRQEKENRADTKPLDTLTGPVRKLLGRGGKE